MRSYPLTPLAVLLLAALAFLLPAAAENPAGPVAMLGGSPSRNQVNLVDRNVPDDFAVKKGKEKNVKWSAALGQKSYSSPVVAGDRVFVATDNKKPRDPKVKGSRGVLMCFRASTGAFLWQHAWERGEEGNDTDDEPLISSPAVEDDILWYVNNLAQMVCSTVDGKVVWTYDMVKELDVYVGQHVYTSPVVVGDLVYAMTCNGREGNTNKLHKPHAPSLVAVNKKTGKLAWSNALPGAAVIRGQWTNPTAARVHGSWQVVYGGGDGWVYGLDAKSGDLLWKFDCNPKKAKPYRVGGAGEKCFVIASPVVVDDRCYVGVGQEPDDGPGVGHLWCIDVSKKPRGKDKDLSPVGDDFDPRSPANKDSGLVWHRGGPIVPTPMEEGREFVFGRTMSTVAVHDGLVYAVDLAGFLDCLDARTGEKVWEYDFNESTWCSPYYVDGKVFVGVDSGDLFVFKAGKKLTTPKKIEIGPSIKVPPVAAGGVLYLNTGPNLYAIAPK